MDDESDEVKGKALSIPMSFYCRGAHCASVILASPYQGEASIGDISALPM